MDSKHGLQGIILKSLFFTDSIKITTGAQLSARKTGIQKLKQGIHTQQWRLQGLTGPRQALVGPFATLGPVGALGPATITAITLNIPYFNAYRQAGGNLSYQDFIMAFSKVIHIIQKEAHRLIDIWVPLGENIPSKGHIGGTLRKVMHNSVNNAQDSSFPMSVSLDTFGAEYANPVNNMPTTSLQRSGKAPKARKGFFNLILLNCKNKAKKEILQTLKRLGQSIDKTVIANLGRRSGYSVMIGLIQYGI